MEGVRGSNPLSSTNKVLAAQKRYPISLMVPVQLGEPLWEPSCGLPVWLGRTPWLGRRRHSLGYAADGKRIREKVSGQTRTEVKDKLKALHSELDAGVRTAAGYTVDMAVTDWLAEGLQGRAAKTVEVYADSLRPVSYGDRADPGT